MYNFLGDAWEFLAHVTNLLCLEEQLEECINN